MLWRLFIISIKLIMKIQIETNSRYLGCICEHNWLRSLPFYHQIFFSVDSEFQVAPHGYLCRRLLGSVQDPKIKNALVFIILSPTWWIRVPNAIISRIWTFKSASLRLIFSHIFCKSPSFVSTLALKIKFPEKIPITIILPIFSRSYSEVK